MDIVDRLLNGGGRILEAAKEGKTKRGFFGALGYGASAMAGEAFVQPLAAGMSLFGEGHAIDQRYQKQFKGTIAEVAKHDDSHADALLMLGVSSVCNTAELSVAAADGVIKKIFG